MPIAGNDDWRLLVQGHAIDFDDIHSTSINYYTQIMIYGDPEVSLPGEVATLTFAPNLVNYVHWWQMDIDWQFYWGPDMLAHDDFRWGTFAESHNDNFITLSKPLTQRPLYLTPLSLGTAWANYKSEEVETVEHMWGGVEIRNVRRAEQLWNVPLYYYANWNVTNMRLKLLLRDESVGVAPNQGGDGQCGSWAEFWGQVLASQGITSTLILVTPNKPLENMLISNWNFGGQNVSYPDGGYTYGWRNTTNLGSFYNDHEYTFNVAYVVTDQDGVAGQNTDNPLSAFGLHYIVYYVYEDPVNPFLDFQQYYDPSYGLTYESELDFETRAVAGYFMAVGSSWYIRKNETSPRVPQLSFTPQLWP